MATIYLYPDGVAADSSAWTLTGAATKWEAIADPQNAPDDDTSYLECLTTIVGPEEISFTFDNMPEVVSITSVTVVFRSKKTAGSGNHQTFINGNGGAGHILDTVYDDFSDVYTTDPDTGEAWSQAKLNSTVVLIRQDATVMTARLTQMYLQVDFVPSAAKIGAARDVGSRVLRLFRLPVQQPVLEGPLAWSDLELLEDAAVSHFAYPDDQEDSGAGMQVWERALGRLFSTSLNLDDMTTAVTLLDLRHYLCRFWDAGISEEAASATAPGAARLDPGATRDFSRATKAWVQNAAVAAQGSVQLIEIGSDIEKAETLGMLFEPERTNDLLNSHFNAGSFTSWTTTGNVVADTADLVFHEDVSAQSAKFARAGAANCRLAQTTAAYAGSEVLTFSAWHKDDSATALQVTIQRSTDSFYWVTGSTWQAGVQLHSLTVRSTPRMDQLGPIVLSAAAQSITVTFRAEGVNDQINHLYHAQLEEGRYATSPKVSAGSVTTGDPDVLRIQDDAAPGQVWWPDQQTAGGTVVFEWNSSDTSLDDAVLLDIVDDGDADRWERVLYSPASGQWRYELRTGGTTYAATKTAAVVRGTPYRWAARRTGSALELGLDENTLSIFVDGVKGTDDVSPSPGINGAWLYIGSRQGVDSFAGGNISHVTTTVFALADEEIPDWQ